LKFELELFLDITCERTKDAISILQAAYKDRILKKCCLFSTLSGWTKEYRADKVIDLTVLYLI